MKACIRVCACLLVAASAQFPSFVMADGSAQYSADAFISHLDATMIGQRTAYTAPGGLPIPPVPALIGLVNAGTVIGQFEYTCGDPGPDGAIGPEDCPDAAYIAENLEWKWGLLKVTDGSGFPFIDAEFVEVAGVNLFASDIVANEGFTFVETQSFNGKDISARLAHFAFNIEGAGVTLDPGFSYIFFALLSEFPLPDRVPGEGAGFSGIAEESIYESAVLEAPPFQYHQNPVIFDPSGELNQLATSGLIPVVPEPSTAIFLAIAACGLVARRRKVRAW